MKSRQLFAVHLSGNLVDVSNVIHSHMKCRGIPLAFEFQLEKWLIIPPWALLREGSKMINLTRHKSGYAVTETNDIGCHDKEACRLNAWLNGSEQ